MTTKTERKFVQYPGWEKDLAKVIVGGAPNQEALNRAVRRLQKALYGV